MNHVRDALGAYVAALPDEARKKLAQAQQPTLGLNTDLINELMDRLNYDDRHMAAMYLIGYLVADRDPKLVKKAVANAAAAIGHRS